MNGKQAFFGHHRFEGLTFDDVRLKTGRRRATKMPHQVDILSRFSRNVPLRIPIVSAAMDTVTESGMAIRIAELGGLGIIHKNLSPKEQADEVTRVKYHVNGLIDGPVCVRDTDTIESILAMRKEKKFEFHRFPVIDQNGRLVGVLTKSDFELCRDRSVMAKDQMTTRLVTTPEGTDLDTAFDLMYQNKVKMIPLINADNKPTGLYLFSDLERIKSEPEQRANTDERGQLIVGAAIGTGEDTLERVELLVKARVNVIVIDTAHADGDPVFDLYPDIRAIAKNVDLVPGNVSEPESAIRLLELGIDGLKVGQGPGSICTTRIVAGIGCPQVTAIYNCANAVDVPLCGDGGVRFTGDIPIAIGAGASSVMLGSMLAGTKECPGDTVNYKGRLWKVFRGMGSLEAMSEHRESRNRYYEVADNEVQFVPEGISGFAPYKGPLGPVIFQYIGGLRKGMAYVGATTIEEMQTIAEFRRISAAGQRESHPHDVLITKDAPNYPGSES